jgi:adenosylmethionine-8-amino-7-oxononanoate aminotransferase
MGEYLIRSLQSLYRHDFVGDVRGKGLFVGIEFVKDKKTKESFDPKFRLNAIIANRAFEKGLITYPGGGGADGIKGDHLLLAPPFIITEVQVDKMVSILDQTFTEISREI